MILIDHKKKRLKLMVGFLGVLFGIAFAGIIYYWNHETYVSSSLLKLPYGLNLLRFPISMLWISIFLFMLWMGAFCYRKNAVS